MVFADTPQMLGADDLIDFLAKRGSAIFEQGCKALDNKAPTDGFAMTPNQTVIFVEAFPRCATAMGWDQGTRQITTFTNSAGHQEDIIKTYGQISKATLKTARERFGKPGKPDSQTCAKQKQHNDEHLPSKIIDGRCTSKNTHLQKQVHLQWVGVRSPHVQDYYASSHH